MANEFDIILKRLRKEINNAVDSKSEELDYKYRLKYIGFYQ
jgi:uncharacterized protein YajQ (UPF0234 family)